MRSSLLLLLCLVAAETAGAQSPDYFSLKNTLPPAVHGAAAFGDVDGDGSMDLFITGSGPAGITARLLRFEGLYFAPAGQGVTLAASYSEVATLGLRAVAYAAAEWADVDNDGDLDLIVTGSTRATPPYEPFIQLFRNDGFMQLAPVQSGIEPLYGGSIAWGDFDNDGRVDLLMTGAAAGSGAFVARLLRNRGGMQFESVATPFEGKAFGQAKWVDYDTDGDLDLLITGASSPEDGLHQPRLYRNDGGVFSEVAAGFESCLGCSVAWADYDGDGDPDLVLSGARPYPGTLVRGRVSVYRNDGGSFVRVDPGIPPRTHGGVAWGDMDGDGRPDIVLNGAAGLTEAALTEIYRNTGGGFEQHFLWPGGVLGAVAVTDFDADGDLEFLAGGIGVGNAILVHNQTRLRNPPPSAPGGLLHEVEGGVVTLRWLPATDAQTPSEGLTYNLRVGTSPGGGEVLSAMAVPGTGRRHISAAGNVWQNKSWTLRNLPPGRYFWSVQALDASYAGSVFAVEQTFVVP